MALFNNIGGFLGKVIGFFSGKSKAAKLFESLKNDPTNQSITAEIKQLFADKPVDVVLEVMRRVAQIKKSKPATEQNLFVKFRQTWQNTIHRERVQPLQLVKPVTKAELVQIVKDAESKQLLVRAVGCGHSFSDVANATDIQVNMLGLNKTLPLETNTFKPGLPTLYSCEAGILVQKINTELDALGLALPTMAAFDQETVYGAIATSTHGTGIRVSGMPAMVRSLDLIAAGGKCYRLEPANGITDPVKFKAQYPNGEITLLQDDDKFNSTVVGFGLMGIVYSIVIAPVQTFYLMQRLWVSNWKAIKPKLESRQFFVEIDPAGKVVANDPVSGEPMPTRAQVFVNPYITKNFKTKEEGHTCVVQVQTTISKAEYDSLNASVKNNPPRKVVGLIEDLLSNGTHGIHEATISGEDKNSIVEEISTDALLELLNIFPTLSPLFLDISMLVLLSGSGKFGKGYVVMNQGKLAVKNAGYSVEPGLAVDANNTFIKGAEEIIRVAAVSEASFSYLTSPMCMRFVKQSEDYLSPEYKSDTCMIDVPLILGTIGDNQMLDRMQLNLLAIGARPHWGKICNLVNGRELIGKMYPKFPQFLDTVAFFNPNGTFNGRFSMRSGISEMAYKK
jgi:L-gulono-1,4-lactone dehydrogenase